MNNSIQLSIIEHNLLSMQMNDIEPLHILYAETKRDIKETTLNEIVLALVKLVTLGFCECEVYKNNKFQLVENVTAIQLLKRFEGQSEQEKFLYPNHADEYYFRITDRGRIEEAKDIYDDYYK